LAEADAERSVSPPSQSKMTVRDDGKYDQAVQEWMKKMRK